jgi:ubiquitin carboxyl-terminal hydrolase L5
MFKYQQDGVQFNLLSVCRSPLSSCPERITENFHAIGMLTKILETIQPDWKQFTEAHEATILTGADNALGVTQELINRTTISDELIKRIKCVETDGAAAILLYQELVRDQMELQRGYWDEMALIGQENEQADSRKHDYTSLIYNSIRTLSEKRVLREIVDESQ